jgi:hypothetical protein
MKSLKDYIDSIPVQEDIEELEEVSSKQNPKDPPAIMVMRRKSIRQFPNGQRVALYYVDSIKKYVSIPFDDKGISLLSVEEFEEPETQGVIHQLQEIVSDETTRRIVFEDNTTLVVDRLIANAVLKMYEALTDNNKQKVFEMAQKSKHQFKEIVEFAKKHVN